MAKIKKIETGSIMGRVYPGCVRPGTSVLAYSKHYGDYRLGTLCEDDASDTGFVCNGEDGFLDEVSHFVELDRLTCTDAVGAGEDEKADCASEDVKHSERYCLILDRKQAETLTRATELYARLGIGQFERISEMMLDVQNVDEFCKRERFSNELLRMAACVIFGTNEFGSICLNKTPDHFRAWNIYQAVRYRMAKHDNPNGDVYSVSYDPPYPSGGYPVPMCSVMKSGETRADTEAALNEGE